MGKGRKRKMAATQLPSCHHLSPVTFFQWGCHYSNLMHSFCQFCSANMQRVRHCKIGPSRFQMSHQALHVFIGPRCPWGPIYESGCLSLTGRAFADLTDVTLADEDTNSILTDNANRAFQGNVAMQVAPSGGQICN